MSFDIDAIREDGEKIRDLAVHYSDECLWPIPEEDLTALAVETATAIYGTHGDALGLTSVRAQMLRPLRDWVDATDDEDGADFLAGIDAAIKAMAVPPKAPAVVGNFAILAVTNGGTICLGPYSSEEDAAKMQVKLFKERRIGSNIVDLIDPSELASSEVTSGEVTSGETATAVV